MFVRLGRLEGQFRKIRRSIWVASSLPKPYRKFAYGLLLLIDEISNCVKGVEHKEREKRLSIFLSQLCGVLDKRAFYSTSNNHWFLPDAAYCTNGKRSESRLDSVARSQF